MNPLAFFVPPTVLCCRETRLDFSRLDCDVQLPLLVPVNALALWLYRRVRGNNNSSGSFLVFVFVFALPSIGGAGACVAGRSLYGPAYLQCSKFNV